MFATIGSPHSGPSAAPNDPDKSLDSLTVSRGADLPSRDGGGGIYPKYEFIGIPYNGWGCESPFVADV
jgi:hypothetical protein